MSLPGPAPGERSDPSARRSSETNEDSFRCLVLAFEPTRRRRDCWAPDSGRAVAAAPHDVWTCEPKGRPMGAAGSSIDVTPSIRRLADLLVSVGTEVKPGTAEA